MPSPEPWEVVHPDPNLHLNGIKWGTEAGVRAGEFTVTLTGHWAVEVRMVGAKGPDVAWGEIAGPIPADTTCVRASAPATSGYVQYDATDDLIRWQDDLAPGQTVTVTFMVWVHDTVIPGTLITNRAHLGPDVFTATTRIEAADTHWDEFIHDGWYAGQAPPALPPVTIINVGMAAVPGPINPAERPGLLSLQRFWSFLPFIRR